MEVFDDTFLPPGLADPGSRIRPVVDRHLDACPACGSDEVEPVTENRTPELHWFCRNCGRCWHVELGTVNRITPPVCFGCQKRARCEAVYVADQERVLGL